MDHDLETRFAVHEAICNERSEKISEQLEKGTDRMQKIEYLLYGVMIMVLLGPGAAAEFLKKIFTP
jgi:predicted nucleic acid-binding Zn ribbon protein